MKDKRNMLNEVCKLLNEYAKNFKKYKNILSRTKDYITKEVLKSKEKEKAGITKRLGDLTVEQREVENYTQKPIFRCMECWFNKSYL